MTFLYKYRMCFDHIHPHSWIFLPHGELSSHRGLSEEVPKILALIVVRCKDDQQNCVHFQLIFISFAFIVS